MAKHKAIEVIKDKFWIIESHGNKIGTLKFNDSKYKYFNNKDGNETVFDNLNSFTIVEKKSKTFVNDTVYGYPANTEQAHEIDLLDNVPVFKKTANSSIHFAAGYYCLQFPMGWRPSFCPRYDTLQKYPYVGPFKSEQDMNITLSRKGQKNEEFNN